MKVWFYLVPQTCIHTRHTDWFTRISFLIHLSFPLTHLQCRGLARLDWRVPPASCLSKGCSSALSEMPFLPAGLSDSCSNKDVCVLCVCAYVFAYVDAYGFVCGWLYLYSVWACLRLLLSLSRLMSRLRSCCRKPGFGQMSLCGLTAATASCSLRPSTIIKKASTKVADRLTPIKQCTNTRPGIEMINITLNTIYRYIMLLKSICLLPGLFFFFFCTFVILKCFKSSSVFKLWFHSLLPGMKK